MLHILATTKSEIVLFNAANSEAVQQTLHSVLWFAVSCPQNIVDMSTKGCTKRSRLVRKKVVLRESGSVPAIQTHDYSP